MASRRKDGGVEAPVNLGGFFGVDSDDSADEQGDGFKEVYETQDLDLCGSNYKIRQFSWHRANANKVWPGTFNLAEFIEDNLCTYNTGRILELGAATGALSMYMMSKPRSLDVVTSDIDDGGEASQLSRTSRTLGAPAGQAVPLWLWRQLNIAASDVLLYVSAYPALVLTLSELFDAGTVQEFLMSWNRRIPESALFFANMKEAGFLMVHHGKCVYSFYRTLPPGVTASPDFGVVA